MAAGIVDTTMSRDEGWRFFVLGRSLERADMTVRLLSARYGDRWGRYGWRVLLRCASGHDTFLRKQSGGFDQQEALAFVVTDSSFPRSVLFSLREAEHRLAEIEDQRLARMAGPAQRVLGMAVAELSYSSAIELYENLPHHLERLETVCADAHAAITRQYFRVAVPIEWSA